MKKVVRILSACTVLAAVPAAYSLGATSSVAAQDPVKVAPEVYKVLLDNERVRVLDVTLKPGAKSAMHIHPDYLWYAFSDGKARFTTKDGKTEEVEVKKGASAWSDATNHAVENIGSTEIHVLNVELKEPKPTKPTKPTK